jgi:CheY-like chemotaxis protein
VDVLRAPAGGMGRGVEQSQLKVDSPNCENARSLPSCVVVGVRTSPSRAVNPQVSGTANQWSRSQLVLSELAMRMIMVVDDDTDLVEQITEALKTEGYRVAPFTDSVEAMNQVQEIMPDLVLLDLRMDGHSGFELANRIAHRPETSHIPVIAMTGYYKEGTHEGLMHIVGIRECLMKPFDLERMIGLVESLIGPRHG